MEVQFHMSSGNQRINMAVLFDEGPTSPQWISDLALVADDAKGTPLELNPSMFFNAITLNMQPLVDVYFVYEVTCCFPRHFILIFMTAQFSQNVV
jgi:hypothetical protein